MNLEMAVTDGDDRHRLPACARTTAAWCRSGAKRSPPRAGSTSSAVARGAGTQLRGWRRPASASRCSSIPTARSSRPRPGAGAPVVELHTGGYAERRRQPSRRANSSACATAARPWRRARPRRARRPRPAPTITCSRSPPSPEIVELNIGHAIVAHAVFVGWKSAVRDMKALMLGCAPMIYGIGVDVLRGRPGQEAYDKLRGDRFVARLLMPAERVQFARSQATGALPRDALRGQGGHRQGYGHGLRARRVDPRRGMVQNPMGKPEVVYSERGEIVRRSSAWARATSR